MLSQQEVEQINRSFKTALADLNKNSKAPYLDSKKNFAIAAQYLRNESVDQSSWVNVNIFRAALLAVKDHLEVTVVKTREEKEQELRQADSAPGRQRYRKDDGHKTTDGFADLAERAQKNLQKLFDTTPEAPVQEKVKLPPFDQDYQYMSEADQKLYRSLSAENMKVWMKKRAQFVHNELYGPKAES